MFNLNYIRTKYDGTTTQANYNV